MPDLRGYPKLGDKVYENEKDDSEDGIGIVSHVFGRATKDGVWRVQVAGEEREVKAHQVPSADINRLELA